MLAFNFAQLTYPRTPAAAIAPLKRALEITGEDFSIYAGHDPILLLAYVEAAAPDAPKAAAKTLRRAAQERRETQRTDDIVYARARLLLAAGALAAGRYSQAERDADEAVRVYREIETKLAPEMAAALVASGTSRIAGRTRSRGDLVDAFEQLDRALAMFPPQPGLDGFDPMLATAMVWHAAAYSVAETDFKSGDRLRDRAAAKRSDVVDSATWLDPKPSYEECGFDWGRRKPPDYPRKSLDRGGLGAALIGFHVREDGAVDGARILAEAPTRSVFGETALESTKLWRLQNAGAMDPACLRNNLTIFYFVMR